MLLRFLIASGPTEEPLDAVRYLTNRSTGVMGRHLAAAAKAKGHRVTWVRCPGMARTARDLEKVLTKELPKHDVLVMTAAVCDVRPAAVSGGKIKKDALKTLKLVKNPDILAGLAKRKKKGQVFVGFALESDHAMANARKKLKAKGLELVVLQKVSAGRTPFGEKPVDAWILDAEKSAERHVSISKRRLAGLLIRRASALYRA